MENIPELSEAIAIVVKKLRNKTGLTQAAFADFASLSTVYIAQLETGQRGASLNALMLIGRAVGLRGSAVVDLIENEMARLEPFQIEHALLTQARQPPRSGVDSGEKATQRVPRRARRRV